MQARASTGFGGDLETQLQRDERKKAGYGGDDETQLQRDNRFGGDGESHLQRDERFGGADTSNKQRMGSFKDRDTTYANLFVSKREDGTYRTAADTIAIHNATMEKCQLTCKEDKCPSKTKSFSNTYNAFKNHYKTHHEDVSELGVNSIAYTQYKNLCLVYDTNINKKK